MPKVGVGRVSTFYNEKDFTEIYADGIEPLDVNRGKCV